MSKYFTLFLFIAAMTPGAIGDSGEMPPVMGMSIGIFGILFVIILCGACYNCCNPDSYHQRMQYLQERAMEAQVRHMENAPPGTVFPIYDYGHMRSQMLGNSQLRINPGMPYQQPTAVCSMSSGVDPMAPQGVSMPPPAYSVTVYPPTAY